MSDKKENSYSLSKIFLKINQLIWRKSLMQRLRALFYYIDKILLLTISQNVSNKHNGKKKVLIVYNLTLGDAIMFYNPSKYFRTIWDKEDYEISIVCQSAFSSVFEASNIYDKIIPLDFSGSVLNLKKRRQLFKAIRNEKYDIVVDPIGCEDCTTNVLVTRAAIAKKKIGILDLGLGKQQLSERKRKHIYTDVIRINKGRIHLIEFYSELLRQLGASDCTATPADLEHYELEFETPNRFFVVFPVASMDVKKWDLHNYAYISKKMWEKVNIPLVICGTNHDRPTLDSFIELLDKDIPVLDFVGKTNIMQFTELIGRAEYVITNDTSAYHIAVARKVPTFMLCGGYTFSRYANYKYKDKGYIDPCLITYKMKCYDCNNQCKYNDFKVFPCIDRITKEDAWKQIEGYLEAL